MPRRAVVVMSPESNQKDLTYLELPPDEQKVSKRPNTNIISDKDRIATSHAPQIDRQELKKILDASRPGRPGAGLQAPQTQPAPAAPAAGQNPAPQPSAPPPPAPNQNQIAKLQTPTPALTPKDVFGGGALSAGSAIDQAARAAAANRGGYGGGDGGNYGLGLGRKPTAAMGPLEVLSDTMGVDFGPYLTRVLHDVKVNWYNLIPESARAPLMKKGKVTIEFAILKNGTVAGMRLVSTSGDVALDRGAWGGIHMAAEKTIAVLAEDLGHALPPIASLKGKAAAGTYFLVIYPSTFFALTQDCMWWLQQFPQGPARTKVVIGSCFPRSTVARADFSEKAGFYYRRWDKSIPEDNAISERQQAGLQSSFASPGRLSVREPMVRDIANWVLDRMLDQ